MMIRTILLNVCVGILFIQLFFPNKVNSQGRWEFLYPTPTSSSLYNVHMSNQNRLWIIGADGTVITTDDGGNSWFTHDVGSSVDLNDALFDQDDIWIVGGEGTIINSKDGGNTWENINAGIKANLNKIQFIDNNIGWIMASDSIILKTLDGGISWDVIDSVSSYKLNDIHFLTPEIGWICAGYYRSPNFDIDLWTEGEFLRTDDGGLTWQRIDSGFTIYSSIFFLDDAVGWVQSFSVDEGRKVLKTDNGGETWEVIEWPYEINNLYFISREVGWGSVGSFVVSTIDGGNSWMTVAQVDTFVYQGGLFDIYFRDNLSGWSVGSRGIVLETKDGGYTWTEMSKRLDIYYGALRDVAFANKKEGWIVGKQYLEYPDIESIILHTLDGGATWERKDIDYKKGLNHIWIFNEQEIMILGTDSLFISNDGGMEWIAVNIAPDIGYIRDIYFKNRQNGWLLADRKLFKTENGGSNWSEVVTFSGVSHVREIEFSDTSTAWVVGHNAIEEPTFKSEDGGETWKRFSHQFTAIDFYDKNYGWAVGVNDSIFKTTNGGNTWFHISTAPYTTWLTELSFTDTLNGWGVNYNRIWSTSDGGQTWQKEIPNNGITTSSIRGFHRFNNNNLGWVTGSDGLILKYSNEIITVKDELSTTPDVFNLHQNYPNPFNPVTVIEYAIPQSGDVSLVVYNLQGQEVVLLINENLPAGNHQVIWNATDFASGIYFYRLQAGDFVRTRKMVLLK